MTMVQIVMGVRLLALASLRSDCLLLRLLVMLCPNRQGMENRSHRYLLDH